MNIRTYGLLTEHINLYCWLAYFELKNLNLGKIKRESLDLILQNKSLSDCSPIVINLYYLAIFDIKVTVQVFSRLHEIQSNRKVGIRGEDIKRFLLSEIDGDLEINFKTIFDEILFKTETRERERNQLDIHFYHPDQVYIKSPVKLRVKGYISESNYDIGRCPPDCAICLQNICKNCCFTKWDEK